MTGVLLVLGGMHAGVVGNADDHAACNTDVCTDEERVSRDVQSHVLHAAE